MPSRIVIEDIVSSPDTLIQHDKLQDLIDNGVLRYVNNNTLTTQDGTTFKYSKKQ